MVTGSKQSITTPPGNAPYNVSKAGVKAVTEALAHELRESGAPMSAHLLIPGFVYTGLARARGVAEKLAGAWTPEETAAASVSTVIADCKDEPLLDEARERWVQAKKAGSGTRQPWHGYYAKGVDCPFPHQKLIRNEVSGEPK